MLLTYSFSKLLSSFKFPSCLGIDLLNDKAITSFLFLCFIGKDCLHKEIYLEYFCMNSFFIFWEQPWTFPQHYIPSWLWMKQLDGFEWIYRSFNRLLIPSIFDYINDIYIQTVTIRPHILMHSLIIRNNWKRYLCNNEWRDMIMLLVCR